MQDESNVSYDFQSHWNKAYERTPVQKLGWYEENPTPSLSLINSCELNKNSAIFNAGAGVSTLIKRLLNLGYSNIIVNDISESALSILENDISESKKEKVTFIHDDLTNPSILLHIENVDLWHDRAVLHFFTDEKQRKTYFDLLRKKVNMGGFVILAAFNLEGAKKCCGLDVSNYDELMLAANLGDEFDLLKSFNHTYTQPSGNTREYVYTLFKRRA